MKLSLLVLCLSISLSTASSQTFKKHRIGETAQQFFSIATTGDGKLSASFCKEYLSDPEVLKAHGKSKTHVFDTKAMIKSSSVEGCRKVQDALEGKDAEVNVGFAHELGASVGGATFHDSKLVMLVFNLKEGTLLRDVVTDITKELGTEPTMSVDTLQNAFGAKLPQNKATWHSTELTVVANEMRGFKYGDMGVLVTVSDNQYVKRQEAERHAGRLSTID